MAHVNHYGVSMILYKATLSLARILVYAWFAHWLVPFRVNAGNIRGNVREDAEQCGQCVKCLTKISKCLKFVHDKIFELSHPDTCTHFGLRIVCALARTISCQCGKHSWQRAGGC